jgi:hypothetical protein
MLQPIEESEVAQGGNGAQRFDTVRVFQPGQMRYST